ncbi:3-isopropylmalate dehydratase small subunit [Candidatus Woesearchaeota archaeon]|nr:3-isopropylmalate dehydratase small subunit [Candidatus Woesearchaeota archaeon]|tara:strand:+ start:812 stop:1423 length:612 start_codon:yes stop_codon:yes gene_type:complete
MTEDQSIKNIKGRGIPLPGDDIDTDRIIPARYLKNITFDGLGRYVFYDVRFNEDKTRKDHPFNDKKFEKASILIVNKNFGCGSSREHAPQALMGYGIKAIVGESFGEIFADNCTTLGIPVITAQKEDIENLMSVINDDPALEVRVDLEKMEVNYGDFTISINQKESSRILLTQGKWDSLSELLQAKDQTAELAKKLPYLNEFK